MKSKILYFISLILLANVASAQIIEQPLSGEFVGRQTNFAYTDENGDFKVELCTTKIGLIDRYSKAVPITDSNAAPGSRPEDIPTACLAAEHWWVSFEILMKVQREYADCVGRVNENHIRLGWCEIDDLSCSPIAQVIVDVKEYWVPFNATDNYYQYPPGRVAYIEHFKAGAGIGNAGGVNGSLKHVWACEHYLNSVRKVR